MKHEIADGGLGVIATFGAILISTLSVFEEYLRIASLLIGCVVGILTAIRIYRRMKRDETR